MSEEAAKYTAPNIKAKAAQIAPPAEPHNQPGDLIIGEPGAPADVRLGMRLVGDDELATVTITQRNKTTTLAFTDSAHAARIADALLGYQPYAVVVSREEAEGERPPAPAVQGEPVAWMVTGIRPDFDKPIKALHSVQMLADEQQRHWEGRGCLVYQTPLYTAPQPSGQPPFEWPLLDAPAMIGSVTVGKGCSAGHVVAIAKRAYQYEVETSPEEHERRQRAFRETLAKIHQRDDRSPEDRWVEQETLDAEGLADLLEQCVTSMLDSGYRADATVIRGVQLAIDNLRSQGGEA